MAAIRVSGNITGTGATSEVSVFGKANILLAFNGGSATIALEKSFDDGANWHVASKDATPTPASSTGQIANFSWHEMGTGGTAEAIGDTTLVTAVETRTDGTQVEGASANIYRSVGTVTATATRAIVEHGLFDASTAGNLMDRSVFTVINLSTDDAIQFTYELTVPAGS